MSPTAVHFLCSSCPAAGPKGSHTFCSICFGIEDFTSSPALNLRGSDKSEQCITEGAFFFFHFGYSVDGRSNKYMHFGCLLVIQKSLINLESCCQQLLLVT